MRTLEDIIPPSRRREALGDASPPARPSVSGGRRGRFPLATVLIALAVIGASIVILLHFSGAEVRIVPTTVAVSVQQSFTAGGDATGLSYQIVSASKTVTRSIPATGSRKVTASASGPITIYNTQAKPQKLIANTRFASSAGLIFRIHSAVTVPAGSSAKPGAVTATAYADAPGPTYDIDATSFTVPGLAGTPEANAVYARSTAAMTGGVSGTIPIVDASAEQAAVADTKGGLATDLSASLAAQVPEGYLLLPGASSVSYRELTPAASATSGQADIPVEGTMIAIVFPEAALASAIAKSASATDLGDGATFGQGTSLTLSADGGLPSSGTAPFSFSLSGAANLIAAIDGSQIATAVAGKSRSEAQIALTNYPAVKRAVLVLRPFWKQNFPEDPSAIQVTVEPSTP